MDNHLIVNGAVPKIQVSKLTLGEQFHQKLQDYNYLPIAIVDAETNVKLSYNSLFKQTVSLALNLKRFFNCEDVVGVFSINCFDFFKIVISNMYLGIPVATFNPNFTLHEFIHAANISKPTILFASKETLKIALESRSQLNFIKKIVLIDSEQKHENLLVLHEWTHNCSEKEILAFKPLSFDISKRTAIILYSSGTTGFPKGVIITHKNYNTTLAITRDSRFLFQFEPGDGAAMALLPFYHGYGLLVLVYNTLNGNLLVLHKKFVPAQYLQSIQDYKIKSLPLVPTLANYIAKSDLVGKYDMSSVEDIICAAAPLSKEIETLIRSKLRNIKIMRQAYGMTEVTMVATKNPLAKPRDGSCGVVLPNLKAKVIDIESGKILGPMQNGELCFKGDAVMKGYAGNQKATEETIDKDGWLRTGDVGYYDKDGYFYIVDRLKELIKYKSIQVPPAEIEHLLNNHPKIVETAVIGVPDEKAGELPMAFVVKIPNSDLTEVDIQKYVEKHLSSAKWLRGGVKFMSELPKTPVGKILKKELRKMIEVPKAKL